MFYRKSFGIGMRPKSFRLAAAWNRRVKYVDNDTTWLLTYFASQPHHAPSHKRRNLPQGTRNHGTIAPAIFAMTGTTTLLPNWR